MSEALDHSLGSVEDGCQQAANAVAVIICAGFRLQKNLHMGPYANNGEG